jgi:replicative DNA helicase
MDELKLPPHSIEAEQSVLGGLLLENDALDRIADILKPTDFYRHDHSVIFDHIRKLLERNQPADIITVAESLESSDKLSSMGGVGYISKLAVNTPGAGNIRRYAEIIQEHAIARQLIIEANHIIGSMYEAGSVYDKLDEAQARILKITEKSHNEEPIFVRQLIAPCFDRIDAAFMGDIKSRSTGLTDLDNALNGGLENGDLIIIGARPSMGKTALAVQIAESIQNKDGAALIFSCEMENAQIVNRLIASKAKVNSEKLRNGKLDDEDWQRLTLSVPKLQDLNLLIDDKSFTLSAMRNQARTVKRKYGLSVIMVDYIQLMEQKADNRNLEVSAISRGLKKLAKELNIPVIALSQLNRKLEERTNKRPNMADLRESGAIEQDADVILFIYRDEFYNPDSAYKGVAEVNFGKYRNGRAGQTVYLRFEGEYTQFSNMAYGWQLPEIRETKRFQRGFPE